MDANGAAVHGARQGMNQRSAGVRIGELDVWIDAEKLVGELARMELRRMDAPYGRCMHCNDSSRYSRWVGGVHGPRQLAGGLPTEFRLEHRDEMANSKS